MLLYRSTQVESVGWVGWGGGLGVEAVSAGNHTNIFSSEGFVGIYLSANVKIAQPLVGQDDIRRVSWSICQMSWFGTCTSRKCEQRGLCQWIYVSMVCFEPCVTSILCVYEK